MNSNYTRALSLMLLREHDSAVIRQVSGLRPSLMWCAQSSLPGVSREISKTLVFFSHICIFSNFLMFPHLVQPNPTQQSEGKGNCCLGTGVYRL